MKLAVVTGASSGIGEATARKLAQDGYRVVLVARNEQRLNALAAEIGEAAVVEPLDASNGDDVLAMASRVYQAYGVPDVVINSAGAGAWKRIEETSPAEMQQMLNAPFLAAFNMTHAFMQGMLDRGSGVFVHVASPVSLFTWPSSLGYAASRWAMRGMHEALCDDLVGSGVQSCHVVFGKVQTPYFETNPETEEKIPGISSTVRTLMADECADVIARVVARPRRQILHPFMLKVYGILYWLFPRITRMLLRGTGYRRR